MGKNPKYTKECFIVTEYDKDKNEISRTEYDDFQTAQTYFEKINFGKIVDISEFSSGFKARTLGEKYYV